MKIVLTTASPDIESEIDPRFGRGAYLLVVNLEGLEWEAHPNPGVNASGGAGIQAAQFVTDQKAKAVISGDFGPHAHDALNMGGVSMYLYGDCRTAREAIESFKEGKLRQVGAPTKSDCDHGHRA